MNRIVEQQEQIREATKAYLQALPAHFREAFLLMAIDYGRPAYALFSEDMASRIAHWQARMGHSGSERFTSGYVGRERPGQAGNGRPKGEEVVLEKGTRIGTIYADWEPQTPGGRG